jgi:hypothetical protein
VNVRRFSTPLLISSHDPDDRLAIGLLDRVVDRLPVDPGNCVGEMAGKSPLALASIVEDESKSVSCRFFSGQLLALLGDLRIKPDMPAMVDIPSATIDVGLGRRSVDPVLEQWAPYGLQRDWLLKECPRPRVYVRAFRMMRYPVTNYEYHAFWSIPSIPRCPPHGSSAATPTSAPTTRCGQSAQYPRACTQVGSRSGWRGGSGCPPKPNGNTPPAAATIGNTRGGTNLTRTRPTP